MAITIGIRKFVCLDEYPGTDYDLIKEFRVTQKVMNKAKSDSIFMHCLPANRNEEVEASVIDGNNSRVWQEASNRLFVQKEILKVMF